MAVDADDVMSVLEEEKRDDCDFAVPQEERRE
jgi:hypothetical protein